MLANPIPMSPDIPDRVSCTAAGLSSPDESRPHLFRGAGQAPHSFFCFCWKVPFSPHDGIRVLSEHGDCKAGAAAEYNPGMGFDERGRAVLGK